MSYENNSMQTCQCLEKKNWKYFLFSQYPLHLFVWMSSFTSRHSTRCKHECLEPEAPPLPNILLLKLGNEHVEEPSSTWCALTSNPVAMFLQHVLISKSPHTAKWSRAHRVSFQCTELPFRCSLRHTGNCSKSAHYQWYLSGSKWQCQ